MKLVHNLLLNSFSIWVYKLPQEISNRIIICSLINYLYIENYPIQFASVFHFWFFYYEKIYCPNAFVCCPWRSFSHVIKDFLLKILFFRSVVSWFFTPQLLSIFCYNIKYIFSVSEKIFDCTIWRISQDHKDTFIELNWINRKKCIIGNFLLVHLILWLDDLKLIIKLNDLQQMLKSSYSYMHITNIFVSLEAIYRKILEMWAILPGLTVSITVPISKVRPWQLGFEVVNAIFLIWNVHGSSQNLK